MFLSFLLHLVSDQDCGFFASCDEAWSGQQLGDKGRHGKERGMLGDFEATISLGKLLIRCVVRSANSGIFLYHIALDFVVV
jgi:hypothetical protein